jgi:hypothetical protein
LEKIEKIRGTLMFFENFGKNREKQRGDPYVFGVTKLGKILATALEGGVL